MPIETPAPDTSRSIQHDPNSDWPELVEISLHWPNPKGGTLIVTEVITADQYFGRGKYGAPIPAEYLTMAIERMRRAGPPKPVKLQRPKRK